MADTRSRSWCFTLNNPVEKNKDDVIKLGEEAIYIVVGLELAPTTGTPHYQGYVYLKSARTLKSLIKKLPGAHHEECKGSAAQNDVYCRKGGVIVHTAGVLPKQGKRTDIDQVKEDVLAGGNLRSIYLTTKNFQTIRIAEGMLKFFEKPRSWKPEIIWFHGATGCGKTFAAHEWLKQGLVADGEEDEDSIYMCMESCRWMEGYDAHANVLIDELREEFCTFAHLLRLLDEYECRVECKGGSRQFLARRIAITSCYAPKDLYTTDENVEQLENRLTEICAVKGSNRRRRPAFSTMEHGVRELTQKSGVKVAPPLCQNPDYVGF